jgi:hypothetical protein
MFRAVRLAVVLVLGLTMLAPGVEAAEPAFPDVAQRTPAEVVAYLRTNPEAVFDFSPSDVLETMDTAVLDRVVDRSVVYGVIARSALDALGELYPTGWILVAVEAGHNPGWDPGSEGTEAWHNRAVVASMERLAPPRVIVRPIHNDEMSDDLGLPKQLVKRTVSSVLIRQGRASMLAAEAAAWNAPRPDPEEQVHVHELSVHFNAGAGGALVLHQGDQVHPERRALSVAFARRYLELVVPRLNATGVLPVRLRRWATTGLHDDVMMYRPSYFSAEETRGVTLRYGALQGRGYMPRYVELVLAYAPEQIPSRF